MVQLHDSHVTIVQGKALLSLAGQRQRY
jgi:hypothetical protein